MFSNSWSKRHTLLITLVGRLIQETHDFEVILAYKGKPCHNKKINRKLLALKFEKPRFEAKFS